MAKSDKKGAINLTPEAARYINLLTTMNAQFVVVHKDSEIKF